MIESILLGILQGLTEFLPVSSSGHLVLAQEILSGFTGPAAAFDVLLHGGTLVAVLIYFRNDLARIISDLSRPREGGWRLPILLVIGSVPAGLVGVLLSDKIEPMFSAPRDRAAGMAPRSTVWMATPKGSSRAASSSEIWPGMGNTHFEGQAINSRSAPSWGACPAQ